LLPCQQSDRMPLATSAPLLAAAVLNGLVLALFLARAGRHTPALRWLAALVAVLALRIVPYPLGFAGAYSRWQWLTFLPIDATLALGPLLWCYVVVLARGAPPARLSLHFAPALMQLAYQLVAFLLPLPTKSQFYQRVHLKLVEPAGLVLVLVSLFAYTMAAWRVFGSWQRWMDDNLSNRERYRCGLVRAVVVTLAMVATVGLVGAVRHTFVAPLNYAGRAPAMLAFGVLVYSLGLTGIRQSGQTFPSMAAGRRSSALESQELASDRRDDAGRQTDGVADEDAALLTREPSRRGRSSSDYAQLGREWTVRVREGGWYRDPELTLAALSHQLHVSPRTASRVLREGLGMSFHSFVNRLRIEEVTERLADPDERRSSLTLALGAGFASKASFTRAFREATGTTASAIRRQSAGD
jgi:AraC-like DNA-binding protein